MLEYLREKNCYREETQCYKREPIAVRKLWALLISRRDAYFNVVSHQERGWQDESKTTMKGIRSYMQGKTTVMMVHHSALETSTALQRHLPDISATDSATVTSPRTKDQSKNQIEKT